MVKNREFVLTFERETNIMCARVLICPTAKINQIFLDGDHFRVGGHESMLDVGFRFEARQHNFQSYSVRFTIP